MGGAACADSPSAGAASHTKGTASSLGLAENWIMPLPAAHRTTLDRARAAVGFAIPMPSSASQRKVKMTLSQVWENPAREVALVFNGGSFTIEVGPATYQNPSRTYQQMVREIQVGHVAVGRVNGQPAFVSWPRTDATKSNPAVVEFYLHGLDIDVISIKLAPDALLAIADSIRFR